MVCSKLQYYIHDRSASCELQLLGSLSETDVPELTGCWNTAKTTVAGRRVVVDITGLKLCDEAGKEWLAWMRAEGAEIIEGPHPDREASRETRKFFSAAPAQ